MKKQRTIITMHTADKTLELRCAVDPKDAVLLLPEILTLRSYKPLKLTKRQKAIEEVERG